MFIDVTPHWWAVVINIELLYFLYVPLYSLYFIVSALDNLLSFDKSPKLAPSIVFMK